MRWLDRVGPAVSVPCLRFVVCFGVPWCAVLCFAVLRRAARRFTALRPALPCCRVPYCCGLRLAVQCCAVSCCAVPFGGVPCRAALDCGVLCCVALCRASSSFAVPCCVARQSQSLVRRGVALALVRLVALLWGSCARVMWLAAGWWAWFGVVRLLGSVLLGVSVCCPVRWAWRVSAVLLALGACALVPGCAVWQGAVPRCAAPWCAVLCCVVSCFFVFCCALLCGAPVAIPGPAWSGVGAGQTGGLAVWVVCSGHVARCWLVGVFWRGAAPWIGAAGSLGVPVGQAGVRRITHPWGLRLGLRASGGPCFWGCAGFRGVGWRGLLGLARSPPGTRATTAAKPQALNNKLLRNAGQQQDCRQVPLPERTVLGTDKITLHCKPQPIRGRNSPVNCMKPGRQCTLGS